MNLTTNQAIDKITVLNNKMLAMLASGTDKSVPEQIHLMKKMRFLYQTTMAEIKISRDDKPDISSNKRFEELKKEVRILYDSVGVPLLKLENAIAAVSEAIADAKAKADRAAWQNNLNIYSPGIVRALNNLAAKINTIPQKDSKQYKDAQQLYIDIETRTYALFSKSFSSRDITKYIEDCNTLISTAKPYLSVEPGWGDFLKCLAKELLNAVAPYITAGFKKSFLEIPKAIAAEAAEQFQGDLSKAEKPSSGP